MKTYKIIGTALNYMDLTDKIRLTMSAEKWGMEVSFQGSQLLVVANIASLQRVKWKMLPELREILELCKAATI